MMQQPLFFPASQFSCTLNSVLSSSSIPTANVAKDRDTEGGKTEREGERKHLNICTTF